MSRSYKKNAICKMKNDKGYKKFSNHKIRAMHRNGDYSISDGCAFKKVISGYDICDWGGTSQGWSREQIELRREYIKWGMVIEPQIFDDASYKHEYRNWYRQYKMK